MADEGRTTSAGASKIIKPPNKDFEVFLNFRGPDCRYTVVDVLYHALADAGVGVFYDDESIRHGDVIAEELEEGIKKSKIYIPIFSKNYASSKWCLLELDMIIKCYKEHKLERRILPIFFDVEVTKELKLKPQSSYKAALKEHEGKVNELVLDGWEDALTDAATIKGKDLKDHGLVELTKLMVEDICRYIGIESDPERALDDYVGMPEPKKKILDLLKLDDSDVVRFVTIYGLPDMGKTALARLVFEELKLPHFQDRAAFLQISDAPADIVRWQKDLISQILKVNPPKITYGYQGVKWIKAKLKDKKVLIVLDGLDNEEQLLKLAGETSWFGKGSRVIITTSDISKIRLNGGGSYEDEMPKINDDDAGRYEYEMPKMNDDDARKLLCRAAFKSDSPPQAIITETSLQDAVQAGDGNPKAIIEIGRKLGHSRKKEWIGIIEQFQKVPPTNVKEKLTIAYNKLGTQRKEIFLDIACLFVDVEKDDVSYYWEARHYCNTRTDLVALKRQRLIEIVDGNKVGMSYLPRIVGRNIVDETDNLPEKRSRLWSPEVAREVVRGKKGTKEVVALNLGKHNRQPDFDYEQFKGFTNLKFLELNDGNFKTEDFKNGFSELRWFSWGYCQPKFRTINCCFNKLVVLVLSKTQIEGDWGGWDEIEEAEELKVLKCIDCYSLTKTPKFSAFLQLERLVFKNCPELEKIDQSIGDLVKLKHLCLWCPKLEGLPESVGNLKQLEELDISNTSFTTLPESVKNLIRTSMVVFEYENSGLDSEIQEEFKRLRLPNQ